MDAFRRGVRVVAVKRFESNRRAGGRKTQAAMVKAWNVRISQHSMFVGANIRFQEFLCITRQKGQIPGS